MVKSKKVKTDSMPIAIVMGAGISVLLTLGLTALLALLIAGGKLAPEAMGYGVLGILMLSSFLGALAACMGISGKRVIISGAASAVYLLVLLCITALFFGGQYQAVGVTALAVLGSGVINGLLSPGKGSAHAHRKAKRRYG